MQENVEAAVTLDVFGARGAFVQRSMLGGDAPIALSIGSASNISIHEARILPTHGHVALVGSTFYAASASSDEPLLVDGVEVPTGWMAFELPCTLAVGEAFIHVNPALGRPSLVDEPPLLPSTIKDPWAIIARAPNPARLRVPVPLDSNRFGLGWSAPLPPVDLEDEPTGAPTRGPRAGLLFGIALGVCVVAGYFAYARPSPKPALVVAAEEPPPEARTPAATTSPSSAPTMRQPKKPMPKRRR